MTLPLTTTTTVVPESPIPTDVLTNIAEFEIILPCIFGIFVALSLSLVVFYSKKLPYEIFENVKELPSGGTRYGCIRVYTIIL